MVTIQKNKRIDLRVANSSKNLLIYAAILRRKKLSAFILDSALKEAEELVASRTNFQLSKQQWETFCSALDDPAREIPKLKKLFTGTDIRNAQKSSF